MTMKTKIIVSTREVGTDRGLFNGQRRKLPQSRCFSDVPDEYWQLESDDNQLTVVAINCEERNGSDKKQRAMDILKAFYDGEDEVYLLLHKSTDFYRPCLGLFTAWDEDLNDVIGQSGCRTVKVWAFQHETIDWVGYNLLRSNYSNFSASAFANRIRAIFLFNRLERDIESDDDDYMAQVTEDLRFLNENPDVAHIDLARFLDSDGFAQIAMAANYLEQPISKLFCND